MANQSETMATSISERVRSSELDPHVAVTVADSEPAPTSSGLRKAPVIADRYRLDRVIAEGGMGIVFEAWHLVLDQPVAVKIVRREFLHDAEAVQSFMDEARALAELRGPSVAQVLDAGLQDGMPFIVMELLQGKDLRVVAHESGPMSVEKAARLVRQAGMAAAEAHAKGIVHCDLKPENLFLTELPSGEEHVKVIDFGVCTRPGSSGSEDGISDMGSPEYMAPEQLEPGQVVDERADVWALGVVLYELVTGSRPFGGDDLEQIKAAVMTASPSPMKELGVIVPEGFQRLVGTCLEKSPEARFANASALCEALLRYEGTVAPAPRPVSPSPPASTPRRAVPWQLSAAALAGTLFLGALGWRLAAMPDTRAPAIAPDQRGTAAAQPTGHIQPAQSNESQRRESSHGKASKSGVEAQGISPSPSADPRQPSEHRQGDRKQRRPVGKTAPASRGPRAVRAFPDVSAKDLESAYTEPAGEASGHSDDSSQEQSSNASENQNPFEDFEIPSGRNP